MTAEPEAAQATLRVFIAEDSRTSAESLADLLAVAGNAQVVAMVKSEAEALDWITRRGGDDWDLAIVDLILDPGSGFDVIRRLKRSRPGARVVVFSGFVSDVIRKHCEDLGADLVLGKHQNDRLASYVERLVAAR